MPVASDARALEDDRLVTAALCTETREADPATGRFARGMVLQGAAELLQPRLHRPDNHLQTPRAHHFLRGRELEHSALYDHGTRTSSPACRRSRRSLTSASPWLNQKRDAPQQDVRNFCCSEVGASANLYPWWISPDYAQNIRSAPDFTARISVPVEADDVPR